MAGNYVPPAEWKQSSLSKLVKGTGRSLAPISRATAREQAVFVAGDVSLLRQPCVSIIGSRKASAPAKRVAMELARALAEAGIVVMSGLAEGIDTAAMVAAIDGGGRTVGVIGTPLDRAYPAKNARLQERVYRAHLLVSQFAPGTQVRPSNFPIRNKLMCALSDGSVIVAASDRSGTIHQASECVRLQRWLFVARAIIDDSKVKWPARFANYERLVALESASQIIERVRQT